MLTVSRFPQWKYAKAVIGNTISAVATRHTFLKAWVLMEVPVGLFGGMCLRMGTYRPTMINL